MNGKLWRRFGNNFVYKVELIIVLSQGFEALGVFWFMLLLGFNHVE